MMPTKRKRPGPEAVEVIVAPEPSPLERADAAIQSAMEDACPEAVPFLLEAQRQVRRARRE